MSRPLRIEFPGAVYHVTSRGNARQRIYRDDEDREPFLSALAHAVDRYGWLCHAYCLADRNTQGEPIPGDATTQRTVYASL